MAQGPRHLADSFVATGLRKTAQTLTAAEKAQVQTNLGVASFDAAVPGNIGGTTPGVVNATEFRVNGTKVVGAQSAPLTDAVFTGGTVVGADTVDLATLNTVLSTLVTTHNELLDVLRTHGLVGPPV